MYKNQRDPATYGQRYQYGSRKLKCTTLRKLSYIHDAVLYIIYIEIQDKNIFGKEIYNMDEVFEYGDRDYNDTSIEVNKDQKEDDE